MASVLKRLREVAEMERVARVTRHHLSRDNYRELKNMHERGVESVEAKDAAGEKREIKLEDVFGPGKGEG
jgi:hypothetical protein